MVKLRDFFQRDIRTDTEDAIQELMRAILVRAQFVPGVRHALGWRGLQQIRTSEAEGWTARIAEYAGVFGLYFTGIEYPPGWVVGTFGLNYFPIADEALVEHCTLRAVACTQRPDYTSLIREYLHHEEMMSLFDVGTLFLALDIRQQAMYLGMESLTVQRSIAQDGVHLSRNGHMVQAIEPGGHDQDFPALRVTQAFFEVLAASLVFHLEQSPNSLFERRFPGRELVYDNAGSIRKIHAPDVEEVIVGLGYGEGQFDHLFGTLTGTTRNVSREIRWRESEAIPPDYERMRWWGAHHTSDYKTFDKKSMGIDERPPLMILSGFLGAGKTSFLKHFIEYQTQRSRFVAVIQNEIGDVGLDGKLLDYTVTEIDEGCVCCSLVGNLKRAIHGILSTFQPDSIILETTGVANPLNLLDEISELESLVRYDCTVTVVDAMNLDVTLSHFTVAVDQIRAADVLLLNKCDLVSETHLQKARTQLQDINPKAVVFMTTQGDLNPALIFDMEERWEEMKESPVATGSTFPFYSSHVHDGMWCKTLEIPNPVNRKVFLSTIESLPPT
ncbi:MAG: GTP-binding protein, partial [Deltaproteobacteria bacterium]|nr:GTP-binding protein [Deltaproteobacteria bacterium]